MSKLVIGNVGSTYTISNGTRNVTLHVPGTPTVSLEQITYIYNKTQDTLYYAPVFGKALGDISSNIFTIDSSFDVMASTDKLHIQMEVDEYAYDRDTTSKMTSELSPLDSHTYCQPIEKSNEADSSTFYTLIGITDDKRNKADIHLVTATANTVTFWISNDPDADVTGTTGWYDVTTEVTGGAAATVGYYPLMNVTTHERYRPRKLLIKNITTNATNALDCFINLTSL